MKILFIIAICLLVIVTTIIICGVLTHWTFKCAKKDNYIDHLDMIKDTVTGVIQLGGHDCSEATDKDIGKNYIWIEAIPNIQKKCEKNCKKYGQKSIQALLWNKTGENKIFNIYNNGASSSIYKLGNLWNYDKSLNKGGKIQLKTITYKDLVKKYPYMLDSIYNHLVIDVQGAEYEVIEGMGDLIKQFDTIDCELTAGDKDGKMHYIGQKHQRDVDKLLDKNGFKCIKNCTPQHGVAFYKKNLPKKIYPRFKNDI